MAPLLLMQSYKKVLASCLAQLLVASFLIMQHLSVAAVHHNPCFPPDLHALTSFAAAFSPPALLYPDGNSDKPLLAMNESWNSKRDCCSWKGVSCSAPSTSSSDAHNNNNNVSARVTALSLSFAQFSPSSPSILQLLCHLPFLSTLELSYLYVDDDDVVPLKIPECLGQQLPLLQVLQLSSLNLQGPIPSSFSQLLHLRELNLSFNPALSGPLLPLLRLPNLTSLSLFWCSFSGPLPNLHTPLLQTLDLSYNAFFGPLPTFNTTPLLQVLNLSSNSLNSSSLDQSFITLSNLTALDLSSNKFTGPFPPLIGHISLSHLDLSSNQFAGPIPHEWQNFQHLSAILIGHGNSLNGTKLPEWIFRFPKLEELGLRSMGLESEDVLCSTKLSMLNRTLTWLYLSDNNITGSDVLECFALHNFNLITLWIDGNPLSISLSHIQLPLTIEQVKLGACNLTGSLNSHVLEGRTRLELSGNHLVGRIPTQHANLTSMQFLDLSNNHFTGVDSYGTFQSLWFFNVSNNAIAGDVSTLLPHTLMGSNFSTKSPSPLVLLDVSYNELVGKIPASLPPYSYENLEILHLDHNNLSGQIPEDFGKFKNIVYFRVTNNNLEGPVPPSIITRHLQLLALSDNELEGSLNTLFSFLNSPSSLIMLGLAHNHINGSIPPFLGQFMPALRVIDLSHNNLSGYIPQGLWLPSFQKVEIMTYDIHDYDFRSLRGEIQYLVIKGVERPLKYVWNNFRFLDLSKNHLEGVIPSEFGDLSALLQLNLSHNSLSGSIPESLGKLSLLEVLDLSFNQLQGPIPPTLSTLTKLSNFNVSYNKALVGSIPLGTQLENNESYIGDPFLCGYPILQKSCSKIHVIDLLSNVNINGKVHTWMDKWVALPPFLVCFVVGFFGVLWLLHGPQFW